MASIVCADYRLDGKESLMVCMQSGEIKGYLPTDIDFATSLNPLGTGGRTTQKGTAEDQQVLLDLQAKKLELLGELKLLEKTMK